MNRSFFARDTLLVAEALLGCRLQRTFPETGEQIVVRINETEAYKGKDDPASHAYRTMTARNQVMFGPPGHLYVYFTYGMHFCANLVTESEGTPGAVLLRGATVVDGIGLDIVRRLRAPKTARHANTQHAPARHSRARHLLNGPAKLTQGLAIDMSFNTFDLFAGDLRLQIAPPAIEDTQPVITRTGRIGITQAQDFPWRFCAHFQD